MNGQQPWNNGGYNAGGLTFFSEIIKKIIIKEKLCDRPCGARMAFMLQRLDILF